MASRYAREKSLVPNSQDANVPLVDEDELRQQLQETPLLRLVTVAGHVASQRFSRVFGRQHGLTTAGIAVLSVLVWGSGRGLDTGTPGRATHAELARRVWLKPATLTGVIDTLEKAGYVRRERDPADRRVVQVVATGEGRTRLSNLGRAAMAMFEPTKVEQDPAQEAIVREYLIELIIKNHDKE
ncbi:MAG: MarR family transcriptional regulator [Micromonosporaceae bacterium]|nr:MarR family transcriptional regulator [Micromonosporaceae bacterium]